jgi:2-polyprenyl-3-methyl-5-hydroxy-6-metoxy-1,4-benzoquinol methylase
VIAGGIDALDGQAAIFDVITLSHVIEHVHDVGGTLRACHRLLKPGGRLWLETPNVAALGHKVFGVNWRGLEAPRHLVLFSAPALKQLLQDAGFVDHKELLSPSPRH